MCDRGLKFMLNENNADIKMYSNIEKFKISNNNNISVMCSNSCRQFRD